MIFMLLPNFIFIVKKQEDSSYSSCMKQEEMDILLGALEKDVYNQKENLVVSVFKDSVVEIVLSNLWLAV